MTNKPLLKKTLGHNTDGLSAPRIEAGENRKMPVRRSHNDFKELAWWGYQQKVAQEALRAEKGDGEEQHLKQLLR
jgi:hypothetical protein